MPERLGKFNILHPRFSRWTKQGIWLRIFSLLLTNGS
ncbi:MAG: hypothetical protein ACFB0E_22355 [Leptolyngbyaceae cyanobacterium]